MAFVNQASRTEHEFYCFSLFNLANTPLFAAGKFIAVQSGVGVWERLKKSGIEAAVMNRADLGSVAVRYSGEDYTIGSYCTIIYRVKTNGIADILHWQKNGYFIIKSWRIKQPASFFFADLWYNENKVGNEKHRYLTKPE